MEPAIRARHVHITTFRQSQQTLVRTVRLILNAALPNRVGSLGSIPTLTQRLLSALARDASYLDLAVLSFGRALWRSSTVFVTAAAIISYEVGILIGSTLYPRSDRRSCIADGS